MAAEELLFIVLPLGQLRDALCRDWIVFLF